MFVLPEIKIQQPARTVPPKCWHFARRPHPKHSDLPDGADRLATHLRQQHLKSRACRSPALFDRDSACITPANCSSPRSIYNRLCAAQYGQPHKPVRSFLAPRTSHIVDAAPESEGAHAANSCCHKFQIANPLAILAASVMFHCFLFTVLSLV